jgi:hypothetical protein
MINLANNLKYFILKPPYKMPKWVRGIPAHSKVDCIVTYEVGYNLNFIFKIIEIQLFLFFKDKVVKPKNTKIEFELNPENNTSLVQDITITIENNSPESTSTASTQSLTNPIVNSHHRYSSSTISDVWKNRTLENAVELPPETNSCKSKSIL